MTDRAPAKPRKPGKSIPEQQRNRPRVIYTLDPITIETVRRGAEADGVSAGVWLDRAALYYAMRDEKNDG